MASADDFWGTFVSMARAGEAQGPDLGGPGLDAAGLEAAGLGCETGSTQKECGHAPVDALEVDAPEFEANPGKEDSRGERAGFSSAASPGAASSGAASSGVGRSRQRPEWPSAMGLLRSSALETGRASSAPSWGWREVAGRLCELAGGPASATLSCAASLALDAQLRGENVAWVQTRDSSFLPQDLHACGIDLDALVVVRLPRSTDLGLAAEWIARSGAFGLVVLDLTSVVRTPMAMQARLLALAKRHDLALVCLTEKSPQHASLSSLVSLRVDTTVRRPAPARSTHELGHAARHESSDEVAPTFAHERVEIQKPADDALAMDCACSGDLCKRDEPRFRRELGDKCTGKSKSTPTDTRAVPPAAPQATDGDIEDAARGTSGKLHDLATFECEWLVAKDKRRSRPWRRIEARRGPPGLR